MASFWGEIRRRKVFQVAVAYAIVGWLLAQVAATTFPILLLPDWILRAFVIVLLLGFPLAVVLAWAFETTPDGIRRDAGPSTGGVATNSGNASLHVAGALVAGILIGGIGGRFAVSPEVLEEATRTPIQLTANPADNPVVASSISPDGKYLAYAVADGLHLRIIESGESRNLGFPDDISLNRAELDWFPDGTHLLVAAQRGRNNGLWKIDILGGEPRFLAADGVSAAISPDGQTIAYINEFFTQEIFAVGPNGENPREFLYQEELAIRELAWSPNGRFLLIGGAIQPDLQLTQLQAIDVTTMQARNVLQDPRTFQHWRGYLPFFWLPDGRLIYGRSELEPSAKSSNLWQVELNPSTAQMIDQPRQLTRLTGSNIRDVSASADGTRVAFLFESNQADVYVGDLRDDHRVLSNVRRLTMDDRDDYPNGWMPDSQAIFFQSDRGASTNVFVQPLNEGGASVVGSGHTNNEGHAQVTPDGRWIIFWDDDFALMRTPISGGASTEVLRGTNASDFHCPRSRSDGATCIVSLREPNLEYAFYAFDPEYGLGRKLLTVEDEPPFANWSLSPDGKTIALVHNSRIVRIIDVETGRESKHSLDGWFFGEYVDWAANGDALFMDGSEFNRIFKKSLIYYSPSEREAVVLRSEPNQWHVVPRASPDGRHLAFGLMVYSGNVWMIENP